MSLALFSWLLALSAAVTFSFSLFALRRRSVTGALPFAFTLFGEFVWCVGYWWELRVPGLSGKLFWDNVQFLATDMGVAGALLFALSYTGQAAGLRRYGPLLAIFPAISFVLVWSNLLHGLVRSAPQIVIAGTQQFLTYAYGPWFWVFVGYNYLLTLITLGILIVFAAGTRSFRQPVIAFVVGFSAPAVGALLTVFGRIPIRGLERLDISPITFAFTIPLMVWALFRKRMLDIVPIARTLLVEQMRDTVLVLDMMHRVVDINRQAPQLLARPADAVIGAPITDLLPQLGHLLASADDSGRAELRLDQQPLIEIEAAITPLHSQRDRRLGWLVVLRDITVLKQQSRYHRTLADCSQLLLRAGEHAEQVDLVLSDVLGMLRQAAQVSRVDLCRSFAGVAKELQPPLIAVERSPEVVPFPLSGSLPWDRLPDARAVLERGETLGGPVLHIFAAAPDLAHALERGGVQSLLVIPLSGSDGWWGLLRASSGRPDQLWDTPMIDFLRAAADMIAVSMRQWDVAKTLRQAKEDAEAANRIKSTFLSTVSHELRTPLTSIIGYSQLIEQQVSVGNYRSVTTDLQHIYASGQHLLALINDMLSLSRIEAGKLPVDLGMVDLPDLVHTIAATVAPLIAQNRNALRIICPDVMEPLYTDAVKVRQVLLNLLNNAAKFTEDGTITLSVEREQIAGSPWVVFRVADTGIGIDAAQMHRLFMPFSQIDDSLSRKYSGSGIGLALSQRLCQMIGGDISVESRLGEGAVFTARLPQQARGDHA